MTRLGVIDLGSNSVRLVIYEVKRDRTSAKPFRAIVDEKKMAGLSAYVTDGVFTQAGIDRAIDVLRDHLGIARNLHCDRVDIFATAVLRNCSNSREAVRAIEKGIEHGINLLSARDEARLGLAGARIGVALGAGTLIDIGGGSTELTPLDSAGQPRYGGSVSASLPQGSVSSYAQFVAFILPTADECRAIAETFRERLGALDDPTLYCAAHLYGIGGSVRAIAKMQAQVQEAPVKPSLIGRESIDALFDLFKRDPSAFAHLAVKACPDRTHTLVPGMVIVRTIMDALGAADLAICKHGIREGYLMERMLKENASK